MADERHNIQIAVDASGADRGLRSFEGSLNSASRGLTNFDAKARSTFNALAKQAAGGNFAKLSRDLSRLSSSLASLSGVALTPTLARNITGLSAAVNSFRVPRNNNFSRLAGMIRQLNGLRVSPALGRNLASLNAISGFRAPSQAQVRNLGVLINTLQTANPSHINAVATALHRMNGFSFNLGGGSVRQLQRLVALQGRVRGGFGAFPRLNFGASISGLRGLENAFSAAYQGASLLRVAMGALTLGSVVSSFYDAGNAVLKFNRTIQAVATSEQEVASQKEFLNTLTKELPIGLRSAQQSFAKFSAAARLGGTSLADTQEIYKDFSIAFSALGVDIKGQELGFLALEQMMSKGTVQAEELKRQLAEQLPGAFELMAQAIGKTPAQMMKMMKAGEVSSSELIKLARLVAQIYGGQLPSAMAQAQGQLIQLQSTWERFTQEVSDAGFNNGVATFAASIRNAMNSMGIEDVAKKVGEAFQTAFTYAGAAAAYAIDNWQQIVTIIKYLAGFAGLMSAVAVLRMFVSPLITIASVGGTVVGALTGIVGAIKEFRTVAQAQGTMSAIVSTLGILSNQWLLVAIAIIGAAGALDYFLNNAKALKAIGGFVTDMAKSAASSIMNVVKNAIDLPDATKNWNDELSKATELQKQLDAQSRQAATDFDARRKQQEDLNRLKRNELELSKEQEKLLRRLDPMREAQDNYNKSVKLLDMLRKRNEEGLPGGVTKDQYAALKARLDYTSLKDTNPYAAEVRSLKEEFEVLKKTGDEREIENKVLATRRKLIQDGYDPKRATEFAEALREVYKLQQDLDRGGSNGFERWANSVKSFRESLIDVEQGALQGLSDKLADVVSTGKADFAELGQSILRAFNKALIDSILKDIFKNFKGNSFLANLFGEKGPDQNAFAKADALAQGSGALLQSHTVEVQAQIVNVNGPLSGLPNDRVANAWAPFTQQGGHASNFATSGGIKGTTFADADSALNRPAPESWPSMPGMAPSWQQVDEFNRAAANSNLTPSQRVTNAWDQFGGIAPVANVGRMPPAVSGGKMLTITPQDQDAIARVVQTEVAPQLARLNPAEYAKQAQAVTDTILNRAASGKFGGSISEVLNQRRAFSKITGPASLHPYGSWQQAPKASPQIQSIVDAHLANRAAGAPSVIGGNLNYANPNFTDAKNIGWVRAMAAQPGAQTIGAGNMIHVHGTAPGMTPINPPQIALAGQQFQASMQPAMQQTAQQFTTAMQPANQNIAQNFQAALQPVTAGAQSSLGGVTSGFDMAGQAAAQAGQAASAGAQGFGSLMGPLTQLASLSMGAGGGGGFGSVLGALPGLFAEGGLSTHPVAYGNSYASGTPMAKRAPGSSSVNGGFPATLHDNEAVIPLTRGREVPVRLNRDDKNVDSERSGGGNSVVINLNGVKDFNSFKRSKGQIAAAAAAASQRAAQKQN